jgi:hypothetical protein
MQLSTPTASFDSGPLANLLAPGAATPATATTLPETPFADFMPAELPADVPAPEFSAPVPAATGLTPAVAIHPFSAPVGVADFSPALCDVGTPQTLVGAGLPFAATARIADQTELNPRSDDVAPEPLPEGEAPLPVDARPTDARPRQRPSTVPVRSARSVEVKPSRPTESGAAPEIAAASPVPVPAAVILDLNSFTAGLSCSTSTAEPLASDDRSVLVAESENDRGASPYSASPGDRPLAPNATPVAQGNPAVVRYAPEPALPAAVTARSSSGEAKVPRASQQSEDSPAVAMVQPQPAPAGRVPEVLPPAAGAVRAVGGRADLAASAGLTVGPEVAKFSPVLPTNPAASRGAEVTTSAAETPLAAIAAPAFGAVVRPQVETAAEFSPAAVPASVETQSPVWSGYLAQPAPAGAAVESVTAAQPMLRGRNVGLADRPVLRPGSAPAKTAAGAGESITAALPTLASMLPPKSANGPTTSAPAPEMGQGAKTAAGTTDFAAELISDFEADQLNFLTPAQQQVKAPIAELGIDVAKTPSAMSTTSTNRRSTASAAVASDSAAAPAPHEQGERLAPVAVAPAFVVPAASPAPVALPPAANLDQPATLPAATPAQVSAAAHRAVDAVLASTDRFTPVTQSSVDLQLSVGDAPLSVRVEVRAGVVHATFRTDSPELRTALAQEWQAAGHQQSADQSLRLAPAVFANSDRSSGDAGSALAGQNFSQGREQSARSAPEFFPTGSARASLGAAVTAEPAATPAPARRSTVNSSARLHAFA